MENTIKINYGFIDIGLAIASFGITAIRLSLIAFTAIIILTINPSYREIAVISIIVIMLFDYLDGKIFKLSAINNIGYWRIRRRLFDSFADRAITHIGSISLLLIDSNFLWLYLIILTRDIVISGYCSYQFKKGYLIYPKKMAKISALLIGISIIIYFSGYLFLGIIFSILLISTSYLSLLEYIKSLNTYLKKHNVGLVGGVNEIF